MEWLSAFAAAASALAAVLAWLAKIWWSKEFSSAKNEIIKAKDAQIATLEREIKSLQEMSPMKIREYFHSVREQLEEYNEELKNDLEKANSEIILRDGQIGELETLKGEHVAEIEKLKEEKHEITEITKRVRSAVELYNGINKTDKKAVWTWLFLLEADNFKRINSDWKDLRNYLVHDKN